MATRECSPTGEWQMADLSQCENCGAEEVDGYFWRDTPGGELATLPCSEGSMEVATRECSLTGEWQMADLSQCALEEFNELLEMLDNVSRVASCSWLTSSQLAGGTWHISYQRVLEPGCFPAIAMLILHGHY